MSLNGCIESTCCGRNLPIPEEPRAAGYRMSMLTLEPWNEWSKLLSRSRKPESGLDAINNATERAIGKSNVRYKRLRALRKRLVDVRPSLVRYRQPAVPRQPRQRALHHPPVPPQPLAALLALPGYPALDAALPQSLTALLGVVALVGVQLRRAFARATPAGVFVRRDGVHQVLEDVGVVDEL